MDNLNVTVKRDTKETRIELTLDLLSEKPNEIDTSIPFFDHLIEAMAFHGRFFISLKCEGDTDADFHHLVEDTGLVLGTAFNNLFHKTGGVARFSSKVIPMDEALSEVTIDVCGRPTLVYNAEFPQPLIGAFDLSLLREFFLAFTAKAQISLHITSRYGVNSHHIAESIFKAFGKALKEAFTPMEHGIESMSTKGKI